MVIRMLVFAVCAVVLAVVNRFVIEPYWGQIAFTAFMAWIAMKVADKAALRGRRGKRDDASRQDV
ncbi:hypothetical protein [Streptomyces sp. NPDC002537]